MFARKEEYSETLREEEKSMTPEHTQENKVMNFRGIYSNMRKSLI